MDLTSHHPRLATGDHTPKSVRPRRRQLGVAVAALAVGSAALAGAVSAQARPASPATPSGSPATVAPAAGPSAVSAAVPEGRRPAVSADGRWIVFESDTATTDARDTDASRTTVYRTDRQTGAVVELSPVPAGVRSGDTVNPVISADGCVVVAQTEVPLDVFRDDDRGARWDVYRLVVPECGGLPGAWELVSTAPDGTARDDVVVDDPASVAGSGAVVAYTHPLAGAPDGVATITVVDLTLPVGDPGRDTQVAGMPVEAPNTVFRYQGAREPALSANGRHLAFRSDTTASADLPGWGEGPVAGEFATSQVYVWDRFDRDGFQTVHLVSGRDGVPSAAGAGEPAISEDGRIVAFTSTDTGLVSARYPACTPACPTQVFRFDRDTDGNGIFDEPPRGAPLTIVSGATRPGEPLVEAGDAPSWAPAVNIDGSQVAFVTDARNLIEPRVPGGGEITDGDIVIAEVLTGQTHRVTDALTGSRIPGAHSRPALSGTGRLVVFDTVVAAAITGDAALTGRHVVATTLTPRLSMASADFGSVLVGWESEELYVSVINDGPGAFQPTAVTSSSRNFKITEGGTCRRGVVVPAGSSCTVYLTFNPTSPTGFSATITAAESGFEAVSVSTSVRGTGGEPVLQANPPGLDLEPAVVGGERTRATLDIENVSFTPTRIGSIDVTGTNADEFAVVGQSCTNRALNPQASCTIEIEFAPRGAGRRLAVLQVRAANGSYTAAILSGEGSYQASLQAVSPTVRAGGALGVGGQGFPAGGTVVLQFADGGEPFAIVTTNEAGVFLAEVVVPSREPAGRRTLVAFGPDDVVATVELDVVGRRPASPGMPGMPGGPGFTP